MKEKFSCCFLHHLISSIFEDFGIEGTPFPSSLVSPQSAPCCFQSIQKFLRNSFHNRFFSIPQPEGTYQASCGHTSQKTVAFYYQGSYSTPGCRHSCYESCRSSTCNNYIHFSYYRNSLYRFNNFGQASPSPLVLKALSQYKILFGVNQHIHKFSAIFDTSLIKASSTRIQKTGSNCFIRVFIIYLKHPHSFHSNGHI